MTHLVQPRPTAVRCLHSPRLDARVPDAGSDIPAVRTDAVYVAYTAVEETLAAARAALDFASTLNVRVTVVHVRAVAYPLPVDAPTGISPIETDEFGRRLQAEGLNVRLKVVLCRDERAAVASAFAEHSLIVIAGRRGWWPTRAQRMRRMLEAAGHFVVFVDTRDPHAHVRRAAGPISQPVEAPDVRHA